MKYRQLKSASRLMLSAVVLLVLVSLSVLFIYVLPIRSIAGSSFAEFQDTKTVAQLESVKPGVPARLVIPAIKVNTIIESVGLTDEGAVGVPRNFVNVAWFNLWPRPGEEGSAIITGHYGRVRGKASVFDNLHKLKLGDKIYVEDKAGLITTFVVRKMLRYNPQANATEVFRSHAGQAHLNIITCEGWWDKITKSYSQRLVVFTDKE